MGPHNLNLISSITDESKSRDQRPCFLLSYDHLTVQNATVGLPFFFHRLFTVTNTPNDVTAMDLTYPTTTFVKPEALEDQLSYPGDDSDEELRSPVLSPPYTSSSSSPAPLVAGPSLALDTGLIRCRGNGIMRSKPSPSSSKPVQKKTETTKAKSSPDTIGAIKGIEIGAHWPKR